MKLYGIAAALILPAWLFFWPLHPTETTGPEGRISGADYNNARNFTATWVDAPLGGATVTLPGDGSYRITYTGPAFLDTISGLQSGDKGYFIFAHTAGGADLVIRNGEDNVLTADGVDILINNDGAVVAFFMIGPFVNMRAL